MSNAIPVPRALPARALSAAPNHPPIGRLPRLGGAVVMAIAPVVLAGWATGRHALVSSGSAFAIAPNAALGLLQCGVALVASTSPGRPLRALCALCAAATAAIGLATLLECALGLSLGFDTLIFADPLDPVRPVAPARMAEITAILLSLLAPTVLALLAGSAGWGHAAAAGALVALCGAAVTVLGGFGAAGAETGFFYGSALHAMAASIVAALAVLAAAGQRHGEAGAARLDQLKRRIPATSFGVLPDPAGAISRYAAVFRDRTVEHRLEERLLELASLDGLTGIANRRTFDETLAREWARDARRPAVFAGDRRHRLLQALQRQQRAPCRRRLPARRRAGDRRHGTARQRSDGARRWRGIPRHPAQHRRRRAAEPPRRQSGGAPPSPRSRCRTAARRQRLSSPSASASRC